MICITHVRGFESLIVGLERVQQGRCVIDMSGTRGVRIRACRTLVLHDGLYKAVVLRWTNHVARVTPL